MAKDPAFLFYSNDFDCRTKFLSHEQVGMLVRLMIAQHQFGRLTHEQVETVCGRWDEPLMEKFQVDKDGLYFNDRLEYEINRRVKYVKSRNNNLTKKKTGHMDSHMDSHMENENENNNNNSISTSTSTSKEKKAEEEKKRWDRFLLLYERHPSPKRRDRSYAKFKASVKTKKDFEDIQVALDNFISDCESLDDPKFAVQSHNWFGEWREWVDPPLTPEQKKKENERNNKINKMMQKLRRSDEAAAT